MRRKILSALFVFLFMALPALIYTAAAQPPPPPPEPIPLDGGLSALIVAGLAYGARRLYKQQKKDDSV
ncbi:MAG: hypothetical protein U9N85_02355 [Bacteroidota bacterium]|nr:hypothetical protein [Bacteroidota bacterium]